jgi:hypothetical protein
MPDQRPSVVQLLSAIATNERVAEALRAYPERDHAVEILEDEMVIARRLLVEDLRARLLPHTASAVRHRPAHGTLRGPI